MRKAKLELVERGEQTTLYSICFENENLSEFGKFLTKFKDNAKLQRDFQTIVRVLEIILSDGAAERRFRNEGKMNDRVCALALDSRKLRLYCLRLSDKVVILGNGGIKTVAKYQDSEELAGYVMDLQLFDAILKEEKNKGIISFEKTGLDEITHKYFNL